MSIADFAPQAAIVCAVDDSAGAHTALRVASTVSLRAGLRLVLVHVFVGFGFPAVEDSLSGLALADSRRLLSRLVGDLELSSVERRVEVGSPAELLPAIADAENAVMIVVGARERRGKLFSRLGRELAETAHCPVLVVPPGHGMRAADPPAGVPGSPARSVGW